MHLLVVRFSSMGDVAITVPVLKELVEQNPHVHITMLSRPAFAPLFNDLPNVTFMGADLEKDYKGSYGLYKLYKKLKDQQKFDAVIDLHNVLRTQALCSLFKVAKTQVLSLDKGRKEKKLLEQYSNKQLTQLKTTSQRYADVFRTLGLNLELSETLRPNVRPIDEKTRLLTGEKNCPWVGIAPFAQHEGKMYPHNRMRAMMNELLKQAKHKQGVKVFLFGNSGEESKILRTWDVDNARVIAVAGKLNLNQELALMSHLDVMLSMDSANAHMASIAGVPVVSIWGATHPNAGFMAYGQSHDNAVQVSMDCRPCSIYGDKPCFKPQMGCMLSITPESVLEKVVKVLDEKA